MTEENRRRSDEGNDPGGLSGSPWRRFARGRAAQEGDQESPPEPDTPQGEGGSRWPASPWQADSWRPGQPEQSGGAPNPRHEAGSSGHVDPWTGSPCSGAEHPADPWRRSEPGDEHAPPGAREDQQGAFDSYGPYGPGGGPGAHFPGPLGADAAAGTRGRRAPRMSLLVALLAVVGLLAGGLGAGVTLWTTGAGGGVSGPPVSLDQVPEGSGQRPAGSVPNIAGKLLPSVVSIKVGGGGRTGTGSGFVIEGGYIVTNSHVVESAAGGGRIRATFRGGKTAPATVVGSAQAYDVAVLDPKGVSGLDPAPLGNSENLRVGDTVLAIGSPLGLAGSVTSGIVSAKNRPVMAGGQRREPTYINAIQTDTPINPGNSGGPLVNMRGNVVGINTAIASLSGPLDSPSGNIGVGFAVPVNEVRRVASQIINEGNATYPKIGAHVKLGYQGEGARLATRTPDGGPPVMPSGPADEAGLQPGDVIVSFDGRGIQSAKELIAAIRAHEPGETVEVRYRRGGTERSTSVTLKADS